MGGVSWISNVLEIPDLLYNNTLQEISIWQERHSSSSAMIFMNSVLVTPFIISLEVLQRYFSYKVFLREAVQTNDWGLDSARESHFGYRGAIKICAKLIPRNLWNCFQKSWNSLNGIKVLGNKDVGLMGQHSLRKSTTADLFSCRSMTTP
jgi:hypothetical protein